MQLQLLLDCFGVLLGRLPAAGKQARPQAPARAQAVIRGRHQTATALPHPTRGRHARQQLRTEGICSLKHIWRAAQRKVAIIISKLCLVGSLTEHQPRNGSEVHLQNNTDM